MWRDTLMQLILSLFFSVNARISSSVVVLETGSVVLMYT